MRSPFSALLAFDLRAHLRRPLLWVLVTILLLIVWGLSSGGLTISSGDSTIGGEAQVWVTSEFAVAQMFPLVTFLVYSFFVAVLVGMAVPRDEEVGIGPMLHSTRLSPTAYVWGKFLAALAALAIVLALHLAFTMVFNQWVPNARADLIRGPFSLTNYLRPALLLAVPFLVFLGGLSFAVGERTRKPILVFVTPVALFVVSIFFLWGWSPPWLDPTVNRILMWIEPSGYRWLSETWTKVDLGVEHYNQKPVGYDLPFLLSRLVYLLLGVAAVVSAERHFRTTIRGAKASYGRASSWFSRRRSTPPAAEPAVQIGASLAPLRMSAKRPGVWRTVAEVSRFEARNLRSQPGLYLFVPLILLQTLGSSSLQVGAFGTPILLTPGPAAVQTMNTLTLLVCLLLLFYSTESLHREWMVGLDPLFYSTPTRTAALLTGKAVANAIVAVVILIGAYCGAAVVMLLEGKVTPTVGPFLLVWGLLLVPTFFLWSAFVLTVLAVSGSRSATYGAGLVVMAFTGWKQVQGEVNWVGNWNLWSSVTWTDLGSLQPNGSALLWNRLFWLSVAAAMLALAVRVFPRRTADSVGRLERLRPRPLSKAALRLGPLLLPALALGCGLYLKVESGFQGSKAERRNEDYRARNLLTWTEAPTADLIDVRVDLELEPAENWFGVEGTYRMENRGQTPLRRLPFSVGDHFEEVEWTLGGTPFEPEDWAGMHVLVLDEPLLPGERVEVGFSHQGRLPRGATRNGGGLSEFILPAGVVLTSFTSSFLPVPFFESGRGVDRENTTEPRSFEDGYWEGPTEAAFGAGARYSVETRITGPSEYRFHGVGRLEEDAVHEGRRTVVWRTEHPVSFFNVVGGRWEEWNGDGVSIYYHPEHDYNVDEMGRALEAARRHFSEWFYPYPWEHLKLSEFPGIAGYAQGFPTNITFSENLGFLSRSRPDSRVAFMVTAHESAHQWWANILTPGKGPGGNLLSEGMAHFSTLLLVEEVLGQGERIELARQFESRYGENRRVDSERSLVWTDGSKAGDTTVTYEKGGWVFWMLMDHLGRERGLEAYRHFITRYAERDDDFPLLQDLLETVRPFAPDPARFDAFVDQWFHDVVVPEYRWVDVETVRDGGEWVVRAALKNVGTGTMPVEVASLRGDRFPDEGVEVDWEEVRTDVEPRPGETVEVVLRSTFEPEQLVVDPDARVLMLKRSRAEVELGVS